MYHDPEFWILLISLLVMAVRYDIRFRRIPNRLVLVGMLCGLASNLFSFHWTAIEPSDSFVAFDGMEKLRPALFGALIGCVVMLPLYMRHAMGAGDVKLMAAIGTFLGPLQVMGAVLLTFIAGGVLSLIVAVSTRSLPRVMTNLRLMTMVTINGRPAGLSLRDIETTGRLPYAVAISTGTLLQLYLAGQGNWPFV